MGADLKIRLVFSIPGKPRGRGRIERFFSTVNEMLLCELDGYAPAGGAVRGKPTLTLAEFDTPIESTIVQPRLTYGKSNVSGRRLPGGPRIMTPACDVCLNTIAPWPNINQKPKV